MFCVVKVCIIINKVLTFYSIPGKVLSYTQKLHMQKNPTTCKTKSYTGNSLEEGGNASCKSTTQLLAQKLRSPDQMILWDFYSVHRMLRREGRIHC